MVLAARLHFIELFLLSRSQHENCRTAMTQELWSVASVQGVMYCAVFLIYGVGLWYGKCTRRCVVWLLHVSFSRVFLPTRCLYACIARR